MDEYGEYTWVFSKGYSRGIVTGMTGRYLGGFKVCIMLFFGGNIWKAYWVPNLSINFWGVQNNLKIGTV